MKPYLLLILAVLPCAAATHYVSAAGADTNNGTTKTTSWLHAPGMTNCANNCASYTPAAGDQIILRGGDTWHFGTATSPSTAGGWTFTWSGSSGNPIYIGVDLTWFAGGSWVRPVLTGDNSLNPTPGVVNSQVASCAHPGSLDFEVDANWVTVDNFEFTGFCWNTNSFGNNIMMKFTPTATPNGDIVERCYVHGWTNTVAGQAEGGTFLESYNMFGGTTLTLSVIDGSDSDPATLNYDSGNLDFMTYNVIRYNQGQNSTSGCYRVHDNLFEHMDNVADGSGAHSDVLQCYGETGNGSGDPNLFYNNIFRNIPDSGVPMSTNAIWFFPPVGQTDYAFNNVSEDVGSGGGPDNWMFNQTGGPGGGNLVLQNNTFVVVSAAGVVRNDLGGGGTVTAANNHYIVTPATQGNVYVNSITETNAVYQTNATATTQGYVAGNNYAPTAGTNSTVGAGTNETSFCSGLADANARTSCQNGTTNGCTYVTATHSVSCPTLTANARPSSGAWDAGAYEFSSGGTAATPTFSPVAGTYTSPQSVTISTTTGGATICWTNDGSTPLAATPGTCSHGTTYSGTVTVSSSLTLKAIATLSAFTNSTVGSAAYVLPGITITSPTNLQIVQSVAPLPLTVALTNAASARYVNYSIDGQQWCTQTNADSHPIIQDYRDAWTGVPFGCFWYPGLAGDGTHVVSACAYTSLNALLGTCSTQTFDVRIEGMDGECFNKLPGNSSTTECPGSPFTTASGATGALGLLNFDGQSSGTQLYVDGYPVPNESICGGNTGTTQSGGSVHTLFNTTCYPNGVRQILYGYNTAGIFDPYLLTGSSISSVSGTTITFSTPTHGLPHFGVTGHVMTFQNSGGVLPSPLIAGTQCFWRLSTTNTTCTLALSNTGGTLTFTPTISLGVATNTPIWVRGIQYTSQTTGLPSCDGYYLANATTGFSFAVTSPSGCPSGVGGLQSLEVYVNPYCAIYSGVPTQLAVSATFNGLDQYGDCIPGSPVSLSGGSGTNTATFVPYSPWWTGDPNDNNNFVPGWFLAATGGPANVNQLVDIENGSVPMELEPKFWEMHLVAGAAATSDCNAGALVKNTDVMTLTTACTAGTWTATDPGGGASTVCSVDTSGNVTPLTAGWCNVTVACSACAAGGVSLPQVTTYVQVDNTAVNNLHFTRAGTLGTTFVPGQSFFPLSMWQLDTTFGTTFHGASAQQGWLLPVMQQANVNSSLVGFGPGQGPGTTGTQTSCPNWSTGQAINAAESFATLNNLTMEFDAASIWWSGGNNSTMAVASLAAILGNIGYNRQACINGSSGLIPHFVAVGKYWSFFHADEFTDELGGVLRPAPTIGASTWTASVTGGVITFSFTNGITGPLSTWSQTTGAGNWFQIVNATNTCLNKWYPSLSITNLSGNTSVITSVGSTSGCANGTYGPSGSVTETTGQVVLNPSALAASNNSQQNATPLPSNIFYTQQGFTHVYSGLGGGVPACASGGGCTNATSSALSSIVCVSGTCTVNWTGHAIAAGQAIRIFTTATTNLNGVLPVNSSPAMNSFTVTYPGTTGRIAPANGTYNSTTDPGLVITVDPNWGPDPIGQYEELVNAVPNHPINRWSISGGFFGLGSSIPTLVSYEGNATNTDAAFDYIGTGPLQPYGFDATIWSAAHYSGCNRGSPDPCTQGSGWGTRYLQLEPRSMLAGIGFIGGENTVPYCRSYNFNPACDRPTQLAWRAETTIGQMFGMKITGVKGLREYNFVQGGNLPYSKADLGWQVEPTGTGAGANPWNDPKQWAAMARANAEITLDTRWELQPEGNKPYYGPFFLTDVHTSATYGNQFQIMCASEGLYPAFSVPTGAISGGTLMERILTPYSLVTTIVSGNPSTVSDGWCNNPNNPALSSPGRVTTFIALPPGVSIMDSQTFTPPSPLPYSATKWIIHDGPYINDLLQERATDCTSGCTISFDRHNVNWYYRADYSDSNGLPGPGMGTVVMIPSQGSY